MEFLSNQWYNDSILLEEGSHLMSNKLDFNQKRGFICDMDGVIYYGNRILPGVREFIQWLQDEKKEYLFLTNNRDVYERQGLLRPSFHEHNRPTRH